MTAIDVGTVSVGGRTIAYRSAGDGPPLLLLHGAWSDSPEWRTQLTRPMVKAFAEADLREVLEGVSVPTLLLYGEMEERAPLTVAEACTPEFLTPNSSSCPAPATSATSTPPWPSTPRFPRSVGT